MTPEREDIYPADIDILFDALNSMEEAFVAYDAGGRLILCNRAFREMYAYTEQQARPGVHFSELGKIDVHQGNVAVEDEDGESYLKRKAAYRKALVGSFTVKLQDGRWIRTTDRKMSNGGFVSIHVDITEIKEIEDYLRRVKQEAEIANRAKSDLLANMSHELRTPLNAIIGFSATMMSEVFGPVGSDKNREYLQDIHYSGQHLLALISDILDVSAIEAGKLVLDEDTWEIGNLVDSAVRLVSHRANAGRVHLRVNVDDGLPMIFVDERRLKQILLNLLTNAIKFTLPEGSVSVLVSVDDARGLEITVADTGVGMNKEELENAMAPFVQSGRGTVSKHEGTGLGLPLTKGLVELHGGSLKISSEKDVGTTATVTFSKERIR